MNLNLVKMAYVDDQYIYCVTEGMQDPILKSTVLKVKKGTNTDEIDSANRATGIWMIDLY